MEMHIKDLNVNDTNQRNIWEKILSVKEKYNGFVKVCHERS
jgi:hypothetical protein